jgi:hypothetical protein
MTVALNCFSNLLFLSVGDVLNQFFLPEMAELG